MNSFQAVKINKKKCRWPPRETVNDLLFIECTYDTANCEFYNTIRKHQEKVNAVLSHQYANVLSISG